jgi:hypothetical protein
MVLRHRHRVPAIPRGDPDLQSYPKTHRFRVSKDGIVPSYRLYSRWRAVSSLYPERLESLLDVGACRGYYVLQAAADPACKIAVGIDVSAPFIALARKVQEAVGIERARFHVAHLADVSKDPSAFGGPFQTVLLLNTYHYLFWGSPIDPRAVHSHEAIFSDLSRICTDRLIFSSPLEVSAFGRSLRARVEQSGKFKAEYTRRRFLDVASKSFDVRERGGLGNRPLYLLLKR